MKDLRDLKDLTKQDVLVHAVSELEEIRDELLLGPASDHNALQVDLTSHQVDLIPLQVDFTPLARKLTDP